MGVGRLGGGGVLWKPPTEGGAVWMGDGGQGRGTGRHSVPKRVAPFEPRQYWIDNEGEGWGGKNEYRNIIITRVMGEKD